jgi:DNA-binding GntR family transcriptional regulator
VSSTDGSRISKQERSYRTIRRRILDGTYGPGYRLTIDTLAKEMGMSHVPVREAIRRLEAEGWVLYRPNVGPLVSPIDDTQWEEAMSTLALLEGYATALAAPRLSTGDLSKLRELSSSMREALRDLDVMEFSRLNREFHSLIYDRCGNSYLASRINETLDRLDAIRATVFAYVPQRCREAIGEHEQLLRAIKQRVGFAEMEQMAREHKLHTMRAYIDYRNRNSEAALG